MVSAALALALGAAFLPADGRADPAPRLLRGLEIAPMGGGIWNIQVLFAEPVRYLSHAPATEGRLVRIRVRSQLQVMRNGMSEALRLTTAQSTLLRDVRLEPMGAGGDSLVIEFPASVHFSVSQSDDLEGIRLQVEATELKPHRKPAPDHDSDSSALTLPPITATAAAAAPATTAAFTSWATRSPSPYAAFTSSAARSPYAAFASSYARFASPVAFSSSPAFSSVANRTAAPGFAATAGNRPARGHVDELLAEGRGAMTAGNADRAVLLFTAAVEDDSSPRAAEARELLGLAHQRNGQLAHAKAEYQAYLERWPSGDGATRVRQRLDQLLTAREEPQPSVAVAFAPVRAPGAVVGRSGFSNDSNTTISQHYRTLRTSTDRNGRETALASLDADVLSNARYSFNNWTLRTNLSGTHRRALSSTRNRDDIDTNDFRVSSGFLELREARSDTLARVGRQSARGGGVLGRYDGMLLTKGMGEGSALNLVGGFPVDFSETNQINTNRPFYGVSMDIGPQLQYFTGQLFGIQQRVDGIEDRTAVGGELRFNHPRGYALALVDYDIGFDKIGLVTLVGNARLDERTTLNAFADIRKSPFLTTSNARLGQGVDSIGDLRNQLTTSQIRSLALASTAEARMFTLGVSRQLNDWVMLGADATLSNLGDTSGSIATPFAPALMPQPGTDNELDYTLQATLNDVLMASSYTTVALRLAQATDSTRYAVTVGGRYPVTDWVRFMPELAVEQRDFDRLGRQWVYRPGMRFELLWTKLRLDLEVGYETRRGGPQDQDSFYSSVGYEYEF